jgi:hypothetical protein
MRRESYAQPAGGEAEGRIFVWMPMKITNKLVSASGFRNYGPSDVVRNEAECRRMCSVVALSGTRRVV